MRCESEGSYLVVIAVGETEKISGVANDVGGSAGLGLEEALHAGRIRRGKSHRRLRRRAPPRPLRFGHAHSYLRFFFCYLIRFRWSNFKSQRSFIHSRHSPIPSREFTPFSFFLSSSSSFYRLIHSSIFTSFLFFFFFFSFLFFSFSLSFYFCLFRYFPSLPISTTKSINKRQYLPLYVVDAPLTIFVFLFIEIENEKNLMNFALLSRVWRERLIKEVKKKNR